MRAELGKVKYEKGVDSNKLDGYMRLPLSRVHKGHLYPDMPDMPDNVVLREQDVDTGEGVSEDAVQALLPSGEEDWMVQDNHSTRRRL